MLQRRFFATAALILAACSQSSPRPAESSSADSAAESVCVEIATKCHEHADHSAKAKECHELGHSKEATEEQCRARRSECLSECAMRSSEPDSKATQGAGDEHSQHGAHPAP